MTTFAPAWAPTRTDAEPLVTGGRPFGGPAATTHWAPTNIVEPTTITRSRVLIVGDPLWPDLGAVYGHLTIAWRDAGQPLTVAYEQGTHPLGDAVRSWLAEHPCGHKAVAYDPSPWRGTVAIRPRAWRVLAFGAGWGVRVARMAGLDVRQVTA